MEEIQLKEILENKCIFKRYPIHGLSYLVLGKTNRSYFAGIISGDICPECLRRRFISSEYYEDDLLGRVQYMGREELEKRNIFIRKLENDINYIYEYGKGKSQFFTRHKVSPVPGHECLTFRREVFNQKV